MRILWSGLTLVMACFGASGACTTTFVWHGNAGVASCWLSWEATGYNGFQSGNSDSSGNRTLSDYSVSSNSTIYMVMGPGGEVKGPFTTTCGGTIVAYFGTNAPPQHTNNVACLTVTNTGYLTGQRWVIQVNYGGGTNQVVGPINLPYMGRIPICVTNKDSFNIVACGERPDYDTPECYTVESTSIADPNSWDDWVENDPTPDPGPGNQSTNNDTANIVRAIKESGDRIVNASRSNAITINQSLVNNAITINQGLVNNATTISTTINNLGQAITNALAASASGTNGPNAGLTNYATESTLRGLSNSLMGSLLGPYSEMTNWIAATSTNGWSGASNAILAEAAYISNQVVSTIGSKMGSQGYALTNVASVTQEDRDIWKMPVRTNVMSTAVSYIDLNPLHGAAAPLFSWVKFGIKFFIQLVVFLYMVNRFQNEFIAIIRIPGSGLGKQSIWATFVLWLKSNMVIATVLLGMVTFIGGQLDSFFVSMGGWYASPFSSTIVSDLGASAKFLRAGIEVVEAMFPISYVGIAIATVFTFDLALSGSVVFFGRMVRALTE